MRVALWGYGRYGQDLLGRIRGQWSSRYQVTAVFDRGYEQLASTPLPGGLHVQDPDTLERCFRRGDFDAVICCVMDPTVFRGMLKYLDDQGIPHIRLGERADFKPSSSCTGAVVPPTLTIDNPGYELREIREPFAIRGAESQEMLYLYAADGTLLEDNWFQSDFSVYPGVLDHPMPPETLPRDAQRLCGDYCLIARCFGSNYWHFTFEGLDQVVLMEKAGFTGTYLAIRSGFAEHLMRLAGVTSDRILWLPDLELLKPYQLERVFVVSSPGEKRHTARTPELVELANRVLRNLPPAPTGKDFAGKDYPSRLFVERVGSRRLLGVEKILERYGFVTIVPEELSVEEQIRHFNAADVVVTPHGANSTNALYMRPGTSFIETFPKTWLVPMNAKAVRARGVHYLPVVETPINADLRASMSRDYSVDADLLEEAIQNAIILAESGK